jgi:hypothetical protein
MTKKNEKPEAQTEEKNKLVARLSYLPYGARGYGTAIGPVFSTSDDQCRQVLVESIPLDLIGRRAPQAGLYGLFRRRLLGSNSAFGGLNVPLSARSPTRRVERRPAQTASPRCHRGGRALPAQPPPLLHLARHVPAIAIAEDNHLFQRPAFHLRSQVGYCSRPPGCWPGHPGHQEKQNHLRRPRAWS